MTLHEKMRRYISHTAFLPMSQFKDDDSIARLRPKSQFSYIGKIAMLVDATYDDNTPDFPEEDMHQLDSVNEFVAYLIARGITDVNDPPEGIK